MSQKFRILSFILFLAVTIPLQAGRPSCVELKTATGTYRGRVECRNKYNCWLLDRDGRLNGLSLIKVKKYRTVSSTFSPHSITELKSQLAKELGKGFKIASDGRYIVAASQKHAHDYAQLFDDTYRSFKNYFSRKGFHLPKPEFPLVAIIFPDYQSYASYQKKEGLTPSRGILGYYMRTSNRVALYEKSRQSLSLNHSSDHRLGLVSSNQPIEEFLAHQHENDLEGKSFANLIQPNNPDPFKSLSFPLARINRSNKSLEATIIHEATHQIAFNTGLHSRIGETPKWIIEGLATVFEVPGIRDSKTTVKAMQRVNKNRYLWFRDYNSKRRKDKSLLEFIGNDQKYRSRNEQAVLDAYSEGWALSFFLLETRPVKYARYLRKVAERKQDSAYPAGERAKDFKSVFGNGVDKLEIDFIRFIERL